MQKVVGKTAVRSLEQQAETAKTQKQGPSKFDTRKAELDAQRTNLPAEVTQISADQKRVLESNLRKRMEQNTNSQEIMKVDLRELRGRIDNAARQVDAVPKTPSYDAVRNRLANIEGQFQRANKVIEGLGTSTSPQEMLQLQMQVYQMTQNVELMSKFVEQTTGGIKTILQTQV